MLSFYLQCFLQKIDFVTVKCSDTSKDTEANQM